MAKNIESPKNKENEGKVEDVAKVVVPEERKAPAKKEAKEELSKNPDNLFPSKSLDQI